MIAAIKVHACLNLLILRTSINYVIIDMIVHIIIVCSSLFLNYLLLMNIRAIG